MNHRKNHTPHTTASTGPGQSAPWGQDLTPPEEFFCQLADLERDAKAGRLPLNRKVLLSVALLGLTGLTAAGAFLFSTCTLCYAVSEGGEPPMAFVRQEDTYIQAVDQVEAQVSAILDTPYQYPQETKVALAIAPKEAIQEEQELTESLMDTVEQVQSAWVLTVDGRAAGACATEAEVQEALTLARNHYTTPHTQTVTVVSEIHITADYFPADGTLLAPAQLADVLLAPAAEGEEDAVEVIADLGTEPAEEAQPLPFLLIETVEEVTTRQPIPSPTEQVETPDLIAGQTATLTQGTEGEQAVTERITYRCGVETGRETLWTEPLVDPTTTVIGVGTATGVEAAQGRFTWPTEGRLTSPFGTRYIFGSTSFHRGIDIANVIGTELTASASGTVTWAGPKGTYGNLVKVDHGNGFVTCYAHCSSILVSQGDTVTQGQTIALMGSTGRSTGSHLHFEVRWLDEPIDPQQCLPPAS